MADFEGKDEAPKTKAIALVVKLSFSPYWSGYATATLHAFRTTGVSSNIVYPAPKLSIFLGAWGIYSGVTCLGPVRLLAV